MLDRVTTTPRNHDDNGKINDSHHSVHASGLASVNLVAMSKPERPENRVAVLTEQVALVNAHAQVETTAAIFSPLLETFGNAETRAKRMIRHAPKIGHHGGDLEDEDAKERTGWKPRLETTMEIIREDAVPRADRNEQPTRTKNMMTYYREKMPPPAREATVPWSLLDELEAEKRKFQIEKTVRQLFRK